MADQDEDPFGRWVAEQTSALVTQRDADRQYLERKATVAVAFALGVGAFASREEGLLRHCLSAGLGVAGSIALGVSILLAAPVVLSRRTAHVDPSVYIKAMGSADDGDGQPPFRRIARHHDVVAKELGEEVSRRGTLTFGVQVAALVSALCLLAAVAASRWGTGFTAGS